MQISKFNLNLALISNKFQSQMPAKKQSAKVVQDNNRASRSKSNPRAQAQKEEPPKMKAKALPVKKSVSKKTEVSPIRETRSKQIPQIKSKPVLSKSVDQARESSDSEDSDQDIAYKAGNLVAFVDKDDAEEGKMIISIGKVLSDSIADNTELKIQQFVPAKPSDKYPLEFVKNNEGTEVVINVYQIVSIAEQGKAKGKSGNIQFSKPTIMKVTQLLENSFDAIREKVNSEIEAQQESETSEPSEESEEEEVKTVSKKSVVKSSQPIVRAKRPQANTQSNAAIKNSTIRSASIKASAKIKEEAVNSETGSDEDIDSDGDIEKPKKKVQIGKKRAAPFQGAASQLVSRQVKKLSDGSEAQIVKVAAKPKKAVKKPAAFKAGKWNPDTELLTKEHEIEHFGESENPIYGCCLRCNNRNLIRAIENNNLRLFRTLVYDQQNIPSLVDSWSAESQHLKPLRMIVEKKNTDMLEVLFKIPQRNAADINQRNQKLNEFYVGDRVKVKPYLLNRVDTGSVSYKAYGAAVRRVEQTRGNRQGNQAFYFDQMSSQVPRIEDTPQEHKVLTPELLKSYSLLIGNDLTQNYVYQITSLARVGNRDFLIWLMEPLIKQENYGFNELHLDVLKLDKLTKKYHTASITKKANSAGLITPLHLACINPNKQVLSTLLEQNNDINVLDQQNYKPVHYAAACSDSGPMQVLLEKGANLFDFTQQKETALHIASMNGNAQLIKLILETNVALFKMRDKKNKTAMTYACELGEVEPIKAFLDYSAGKVKVNTGQGVARMTPLMYAASQGNYELAEFLLERKARVLSKDKFKRTALIMAVRNGHTRLASLLLQHGSEWNHADSSNNTPLHYAAGSGFIECIDLLIKHGADVNAQNSWKVTPITIAMLNNHLGTVKRLLQEPTVDVNGKDDKGRTLLIMNMIDLSEPSCVNFAKYLLDKGADPNIADVDGNTPLHRLAAYKVKTQVEKFKRAEIEERKSLISMIDLMISRGAQLDILNSDKKNAFSIALDTDNIDVLHKFAENVKLSQDPQLLHKFKSKIFDDRYKTILLGLLNKEIQNQTTMNVCDKQGFSPYLAYIDQYIDGLKSFTFSTQIREALLWNAFSHQTRYSSYQMTNEMVFAPKFKEDNNYQNQRSRDLQQIPEDKMQELIKTYIRSLITVPFIEFLRTIISKGANPHSKVDKIEFYRELDEHKRTVALVGEARQGIMAGQGPDEEMQIDTNQQRKPNEVKTRKEVLAEQRVEKKDGKKLTKAEKADKRINKALKDFYAKKGYQAIFQRQNGKLVEVEYNKEYGMQNSVHLVMRQCSKTFFDFLVDELKTPVDEVDYLGRNPFMLNAISNPGKQQVTESVQRLLDLNVKFDLSDVKGRTAFLIYYENSNFVMANKLLDQGANIKQMDSQGLFALKYALIRRQNEEISRLVSKGADINQIDTKGRNLLHHAINMSAATADATFETEQLLIDLGININLRDHKQRVPLHYAFVKIKNWNSSDQIDPIETISSLCGQSTLEIDVADKWQKTPLHYAAQKGASISTLYILNRGSNLEAKDIYGNTALGISLLRNHFNYGIILIQRKADVRVQVWDEFPNRIAKRWADEAKAEKRRLRHQQALASGQINANMDSESYESDEDDKNNAQTGRDLFRQKITNRNVFFNNQYGSEDDSEYSQSDSDDDQNDLHEQQVFNQQNAFGMNVFQGRKVSAYNSRPGGRPLPARVAQAAPKRFASKTGIEDEGEVEKELPPKSTFRRAIQAQQQGLAYLILDNGYDYMLAMQDALDDKKFNLVLTLFSKVPDDRVLQQKNPKQQNLMHILAQNSSGGQFVILKRIYDTLKRRGVNCLARDCLGSNSLHYAVQQGCFALCQILIQEGVGINEVNNDGHSPISILMQGEGGASRTLRSLQSGQAREMFESNSMFLLLAKNGADMNVKYPEESFTDEKNYKCSFIINIVRHLAIDMEYLRPNLQCLFEFGARLDVVDSHGRDALMYSIMHNDLELTKFLINNKDKGLLRNHTDNEGKNAIHYVVNPAKFGSFENVAMLNALIGVGNFYDLNQQDKSGKTPLDQAILQESGKMAEVLQSKLGTVTTHVVRNAISYIPEQNWPERNFNFDQDSKSLLEQAEAKKAQELMEMQKDAYIPLDVVLHGEKQYKVYFDGEDRRPYDAYMQKVDLKNGLYGDYVFYKLQLLHDTNRDLYIVLTRWGRIGEEGQNQRSPFNQVEDAKKEFETIFKQKSGNEWATANTEFVKQPKKYSLVKVHYSDVKHQDYLAPFDYDNCAKTQMDKQKRLLLEEIANVTMYQRAVTSQGIDKDQMPISNLKKETLEEAKVILQELKTMITQLDAERAKYQQANYELVQELRVKISDQSSKYFELIPLAENKDQITRPIDNQHMLSQQYTKLELLTSVEFSSRVLLGALYRQMQVNPVDYVHDCLQTQIIPMIKGDPEFDLIAQYISNTCSTDVSKFKQFNLFKLERRGEGERFEQFKTLKNRRLLFHGSAMTNMLGIMSQGLRIAPPEAPTTGYMFGKGVYFADTFDKSAAYTSGHQSRLMLMCEVALGEMMDLYQSFYVENLPSKFNSVRGCGAKGPDYEKKTLFTPQGFQVPVSKIINNTEPKEDVVKRSQVTAGIPANQITQFRAGFGGGFGGFGNRGGQQQFNWQLQHNEYIIYNVNQVKIRYMIQFQM